MPRVKRAERRKHLIILLIALLIALAILLMQSETASALCEKLSFDEMYDSADVVFTGEVDTENIASSSSTTSDGQLVHNMNATTVATETVWKGDIQQTYQLNEGPQHSNALRMEEGEAYLFFARFDDDGMLTTSQCAGSRPVERAGQLLASLDRETAIDDSSSQQDTEDGFQQVVTTERLLLLGMLGLVVLTWLYLRWRPAPGAERDSDQDQRPEHK